MKLIILLAALRIAPPVVVRTVLACCAVRCSALHAHCAISYLAAQKMSKRGEDLYEILLRTMKNVNQSALLFPKSVIYNHN